MSDIEDEWRTTADLFHRTKTQHIDDQIVVTKATAAFTKHDFLITAFGEFFDDVAHLAGAEKLRLFDVYHCASFCHRLYQVCLSCQESGKLNNIADLGYGLTLINFMHVGDHWHVKCLLDLSKNLQPFLHARAAVGVHRRSVRLIKGRLKNVGNTQLLRHAHMMLCHLHGKISGLQYIQTCKQDEGSIVGNCHVLQKDRFAAHRFGLKA